MCPETKNDKKKSLPELPLDGAVDPVLILGPEIKRAKFGLSQTHCLGYSPQSLVTRKSYSCMRIFFQKSTTNAMLIFLPDTSSRTAALPCPCPPGTVCTRTGAPVRVMGKAGLQYETFPANFCISFRASFRFPYVYSARRSSAIQISAPMLSLATVGLDGLD